MEATPVFGEGFVDEVGWNEVDGGSNGPILLVARPELEVEWIQPAKEYPPESETVVSGPQDWQDFDTNRRWKGREG